MGKLPSLVYRLFKALIIASGVKSSLRRSNKEFTVESGSSIPDALTSSHNSRFTI